jgi:hypothetical protein
LYNRNQVMQRAMRMCNRIRLMQTKQESKWETNSGNSGGRGKQVCKQLS